jgi:hypothetical protein
LTSQEIGLAETAEFEEIVLIDMSEFEADQIKNVPSQAVSDSIQRKSRARSSRTKGKQKSK